VTSDEQKATRDPALPTKHSARDSSRSLPWAPRARFLHCVQDRLFASLRMTAKGSEWQS